MNKITDQLARALTALVDRNFSFFSGSMIGADKKITRAEVLAGRNALAEYNAAVHDSAACSLVNGRGQICTCDAYDDPPAQQPQASEKDIERWQRLIYERPEGPWIMGNGGSFDRQHLRPISDEMLLELALWLRLGYTPWNGRSMPLSAQDRQFMFLLYFSVQGLVSRMRAAEKAAAASVPDAAREALTAARNTIQADRDSLAESHTSPTDGAVAADALPFLADYDSVLAQIDLALKPGVQP